MKKLIKVNLFAFLLLAILGVPVRLSAQAVGEIWGAVRDPSGAVVPNAKITAKEERSGLGYTTVSTAAGNFALSNLLVGTYAVSVEALGFKAARISGITLQVNQQREVNFTLVVSGSTQKVTVSATPALINTSSGALGGVITGQQVVTLPLNGRDITSLITLEPGTSSDPNGAGVHSVGVGGWVASNGNRGVSMGAYLDGFDVSDTEMGGPSLTNFNLDAIAEFRVQQNNFSAEYGGGNTIIQVATKSGTNAFHGDLFEFLRNSAFDARSFFATNVPPLQRNEYGGTIGGPIIKNRSFFFFEYAGFRQLSGSPSFYAVPSMNNRNGIFDITGANGQPDQLLVPLNSVAKTVLNQYPLPNDPTGPYGPNTLLSAQKAPLNSDQYSLRVDHRFSEKDSIFGRFTRAKTGIPNDDLPASLENPSWPFSRIWNTQNLGISETHIFSPTLLNTLIVGWTRQEEGLLPTSVTNIPQITFNDGSLMTWGPDDGGFGLTPDTGTLGDTIHWVKGRNRISTGIQFLDTHDSEYGASYGGPNGLYIFGRGTPIPVAIQSASGLNNLPAGSPSPSGIVSLMLGTPISYSRTLAFPGFGPPGGGYSPFQMRMWNLDAWFQDDISVTPKLTLNLGLRYEYNSVPYEEHDRLAAIVDDPHLLGGSVYHAMVLNPNPLYHPDYNGWGPRFGLAYRVNNETVFRGGFGIFTLTPRIQAADQSGDGFPFGGFGTHENPPFQLTPIPVGGLAQLTDLKGNPLPPSNNTNLVPPNTPMNLAPAVAFYGGPIETNLISMGYLNGYGINGNVTVERQLPGDMALSIAYVASNGVHLFGSEFPNAYTGASPQYTPYTDAYPGIGEFQLEDSHVHSTYNALQVELRKTSPKYGLAYQISYTWSKELDNGNTSYNGPENSLVTQQNPFCWSCDKGPGTIAFPQDFVASFIYSLPFDKLSHFSSRLTQGWKVAGIPSVISGAPFTIYSPFPVAGFGTDTYYGEDATRPDLVGNAALNNPSSYNSTLSYFSPAVVQDGKTLGQKIFATPGGQSTGFQTHPGNLGRDTFRAPIQTNFDFSILKDTRLTESKTLEIRAEFFNVFNSHYFDAPGAVLGEPNFGLFGSTNAGRIIQFGAKFIF